MLHPPLTLSLTSWCFQSRKENPNFFMESTCLQEVPYMKNHCPVLWFPYRAWQSLCQHRGFSGMIIYNDFKREHEQFTYQSSHHRTAYWEIKPLLTLEPWNFFRDRISIFKTHRPFDGMSDSVKPKRNTYKLRAEGSH